MRPANPISANESETPTPLELIERAAAAAHEQTYCQLMLKHLTTTDRTATPAMPSSPQAVDPADRFVVRHGETMSVAEVAKLFDRHAATVRKWRKDGKLPPTASDNNRFSSRRVFRLLGERKK
mgnify:CR=1 FL=1